MNLILLKRLFYEKLIKSGSIVIKIILIQNRYIEIHLWNCKIYIFAKKKAASMLLFSLLLEDKWYVFSLEPHLYSRFVYSHVKGNLFLKAVEIGISSSNLQNRKPLWHYYYIIIHILVVSVCNLCMHWSEMVIMYFT